MPKVMTNVELGLALGVSAQRVYALRKEGMPTDTLDAALAWREARAQVARAAAPRPEPTQLDDGTLVDTIKEHRALVGRARGVWLAAMTGGDPNQGKYQTAYNQSLKTFLALEEEQERRLILAKDYISSKEATEAMRQMCADIVNRLDKLALDVAEACNPENPAKAVKALEAWVRRVRTDLTADDE